MAIDMVNFALTCGGYYYADASHRQPWLCDSSVGIMLVGGFLDGKHGIAAILVYAPSSWINTGGNSLTKFNHV